MHATTWSIFYKQNCNSSSLGSLKCIRENPNISLNRPFVPQELHISPINPNLAFRALLEVFVTSKRRETPILGDDDLLAAREFVLRATEGFDGSGAVWKYALFSQGLVSWKSNMQAERSRGRLTVVTSPHREQDLANVHASNGPVGLAPRTTHSSLQSIGTGTRQHLVDADNVVRVGADTEVETFFTGDFD